jgi:hypothetical protein
VQKSKKKKQKEVPALLFLPFEEVWLDFCSCNRFGFVCCLFTIKPIVPQS